MLKITEIKELIQLIDDSSISEFVYEKDGEKVEIKKSYGEALVPTALPVAHKNVQKEITSTAVAEDVKDVIDSKSESVLDENLHKITSPMVGTFYRSSSPDTDAYVKIGDKVTKDSVVCIVEAMKLFNEITAEIDGEIVEVLVKDGELVEYGEPLFLVKA